MFMILDDTVVSHKKYLYKHIIAYFLMKINVFKHLSFNYGKY